MSQKQTSNTVVRNKSPSLTAMCAQDNNDVLRHGIETLQSNEGQHGVAGSSRRQHDGFTAAFNNLRPSKFRSKRGGRGSANRSFHTSLEILEVFVSCLRFRDFRASQKGESHKWCVLRETPFLFSSMMERRRQTKHALRIRHPRLSYSNAVSCTKGQSMAAKAKRDSLEMEQAEVQNGRQAGARIPEPDHVSMSNKPRDVATTAHADETAPNKQLRRRPEACCPIGVHIGTMIVDA